MSETQRESLDTLPVVDDADIDTERWFTVVWDDPVNLMSYVTYVFRSYFGYPHAFAEHLMLQVHRRGRAVVAHGSREKMEIDAQAMHTYGLWATVESPESDF